MWSMRRAHRSYCASNCIDKHWPIRCSANTWLRRISLRSLRRPTHFGRNSRVQCTDSAIIPRAAYACSVRWVVSLLASNWSDTATPTNTGKCFERVRWTESLSQSTLDTGTFVTYSENWCSPKALEMISSIWSKCSSDFRRTQVNRLSPTNCPHRYDRHKHRNIFANFSAATATVSQFLACNSFCSFRRNCFFDKPCSSSYVLPFFVDRARINILAFWCVREFLRAAYCLHSTRSINCDEWFYFFFQFDSYLLNK